MTDSSRELLSLFEEGNLTEKASNPFRDPAAKPTWAQVTRLGGDRVAILFRELRKFIGKIGGLTEALCYIGEEEGWVVQYCVKETRLFRARIVPGVLEVAMDFDRAEAEKLLDRRNLSAGIRHVLRNALETNSLRLRVGNLTLVRSFAHLVAVKSKLVTVRD